MQQLTPHALFVLKCHARFGTPVCDVLNPYVKAMAQALASHPPPPGIGEEWAWNNVMLARQMAELDGKLPEGTH